MYYLSCRYINVLCNKNRWLESYPIWIRSSDLCISQSCPLKHLRNTLDKKSRNRRVLRYWASGDQQMTRGFCHRDREGFYCLILVGWNLLDYFVMLIFFLSFLFCSSLLFSLWGRTRYFLQIQMTIFETVFADRCP